MIYDHAPKPGPGHWSFKCLRCNEDVYQHGGWWARLMWRRSHR